MFTNLAQPFWICMMFLAWADLVTTAGPLIEYIDGEEIDESKSHEESMDTTEQPQCDVPVCTLMYCEGGGPPPFCPRNVTICRSGCACIKYCKDPDSTMFCYEVKFCRTPRRFSPEVFTTLKMMLK